MRASIRQVAEKAQVSRTTVSRVMQGRRDRVNPETYERVLAMVREMNYVPVRAGQQNRKVTTHALGLVPYHHDPSLNLLDYHTFRGLCAEAARADYDLFVMLRGETEWMANRQELRFLDQRSDGFIFVSPGVGEWSTTLETLVQHEVPVVVCYRRDVPAGVAWVDPDNAGIVELGVQCLLRAGHRHIAFLGGPNLGKEDGQFLANASGVRPSFDQTQRQATFEAIVRREAAHGVRGSITCTQDPKWRVSEQDVLDLVQGGVTGVICLNDLLALQVLELARQLGVDVPRDLSVVGVDDVRESAERGLTTVACGYEKVGRIAVQAWIERRDGAPPEDCCKIVPVHLEERATIGPPR